MNMVSNQYNLPLFLLSRNRIKSEHLDQVRNYIGKKRSLYTNHCEKANGIQTTTKKNSKHIAFNLRPQAPCVTSQHPQRNYKDSGHLPPNLYNVQKIPFVERKGSHGAHWKKLPIHKSRRQTANLPQIKPHLKFYHLERLSERCLLNKGVFLPNARERRATTRCMINSIAGCFRDPKEPGPEHYFPQNFMLAHNVSPVIKTKRRPEPYIYLPNTSVPETSKSIYPNRNFCPGPADYENRYPSVTSCNLSGLIFMPGLQLIIDREKRLKFRRLPYKKIKARQYFSPDWHHVIGHGHRHLFKLYHSHRAFKDVLKEEVKDVNKVIDPLKPQPKLYVDTRYINLINNPNRQPISLREKGSYTRRPRAEHYNCKQKKDVVRRKFKGSTKKVAFNSGQERFKISEKHTSLTPQQLWSIKQSLPLELRLCNNPIMTKQPDEIHPKLALVPKRLQAREQLDLRKRLFRFSPIPTCKMLMAIGDTHISKAEEYFDKKLDPKLFFKTGDKEM